MAYVDQKKSIEDWCYAFGNLHTLSATRFPEEIHKDVVKLFDQKLHEKATEADKKKQEQLAELEKKKKQAEAEEEVREHNVCNPRNIFSGAQKERTRKKTSRRAGAFITTTGPNTTIPKGPRYCYSHKCR
jgi:aromatic ring-opening dioxygenase catalytic subunit (LigB family)